LTPKSSWSEAIGRNIFEMRMEVPDHRQTIIGEGGSGGTGDFGADQVVMLQYSIYSVIVPKAARPLLSGQGGDCGRRARHHHRPYAWRDRAATPNEPGWRAPRPQADGGV
jgi:hypothetical protein